MGDSTGGVLAMKKNNIGKKGSELLAESLLESGIDTLFGIISIHNLELHDALWRKSTQINYIGGRTETGLGFMADGFATAINVMGPDEGMEFATLHNLPVFMIIRDGKRYIERMNMSFKKMLAEE